MKPDNDQKSSAPVVHALPPSEERLSLPTVADVATEFDMDAAWDDSEPWQTQIQETMERVLGKLDHLSMANETQSKQLTDLAARDEVLGHVHRRLAAYERDERRQSFVEPLVRKIAPLHRRVSEQMANAYRVIGSTPKPLRKHSTYYWAHQILESIRVELETLLCDFGVEVFTSDAPRFDRACQEAIERVPSDDATRVSTIARRVSPGFRIEERIIVAERVAVFIRANEPQA